MTDVEISQEGMERAKFLGCGIVDGEHVADLWELDMGDYKLAAALDPRTRVVSRNPAAQQEWEFCGAFWRPRQ